MENRPYSGPSDRNKQPILKVLENYLSATSHVFEIASGGGVHAIYFTKELPGLTWQISETRESIEALKYWVKDDISSQLPEPMELDATWETWPLNQVENFFSSNTAHYLPWNAVSSMFKGVGTHLKKDGYFFLYGPFNYQGRFTSESNRNFDSHLKSGDPKRGIRDLDDLLKIAGQSSLYLYHDHEMPSNNRILVWRKQPSNYEQPEQES
ncbi:MAG: DUF938 domain-containing protein [Proteobacteria bacterium]|nr:DUF938 domain-containing protein [Pseudomonadota bacterium]